MFATTTEVFEAIRDADIDQLETIVLGFCNRADLPIRLRDELFADAREAVRYGDVDHLRWLARDAYRNWAY